MFAYLRYFSIISFIVVIAAASLLGFYFRSIASGDLSDVAERSSISLAQGFINTTWKKHLPNIRRLSAIDTALWGKYKEFRSFSEDTFRHFEGVPVTQLNIYTRDGSRVLSVNQDADIRYTGGASIATLPEDSETRRGFAEAIAGKSYSQIIEDSTFKSPSGQTVKGAVVQTFVPILPDSFVPIVAGSDVRVEGVIEVFYDITPQWNQLYVFQMTGTGGILFIFITLLGALFFTSKKAEAIITTQHEANVELAATAAKAEAESRQKSQFLANVSHELRTPLNAIIGFSEIIKNQVMGPLQNEQYMNYIKDIHSSGVHLLSLINDILDFSKAEAGKLELHLSELDATKLLKNCMRLVSTRAEQAGVNLVTELPKEHFVITGDAKKLKQVMLNLLSNAVKFTPHGGEVRITAWQNVMDDSIAIEVKDTGIGIAPKDISRAMSPFGQVDSKLSRKYEGTGLGLPLTKKFVEIMGGTFRIESELNVGTTITITVPLMPPRHILKAVAKASTGEEERSEKQISPQLMEHAAQAGLSLDTLSSSRGMAEQLMPRITPSSHMRVEEDDEEESGSMHHLPPSVPLASQPEPMPTLVRQEPAPSFPQAGVPASQPEAGYDRQPVEMPTPAASTDYGTPPQVQPITPEIRPEMPMPAPPPLASYTEQPPASPPSPTLTGTHAADAVTTNPVEHTSDTHNSGSPASSHTFASYAQLKEMMEQQRRQQASTPPRYADDPNNQV